MPNTANRQVHKVSDVLTEVKDAINTICDPIIATLGVKGGNVLYQNDMGENIITNDGATIAKYITLKDPMKDAIVSIIKEGSLRTNQQAGDGTSTTVLFSKNLIIEGMQCLEEGTHTRREIIDALTEINKVALDALKPIEWSDDKMTQVALVSASNNKEIADYTVKAIEVAGKHGFVSLQPSAGDTTEVDESMGHVLDVGVMFKELYPDPTKPQVKVDNVRCIVLEDKPYYGEDAEHIIRVASQAGYKRIAIFGSDFLGDAVNSFIVNHTKGDIQILLVKVADDIVRTDLATYLGAESISEKSGKSLNEIVADDFVHVSGIMTSPNRTVIERGGRDSEELIALKAELERQLEEDKGSLALQKRLGYLASGIITIKVGGGTPSEVQEKMYKYEDAINAVRNAMEHGYVAGGGIGILDALEGHTEPLTALQAELVGVLANSTINQLYPELIADRKTGQGVDLRTGEVVDMVEAGIIEPFSVAQNTIKNAISVAKMIISLESLIIYDYDEDKDN